MLSEILRNNAVQKNVQADHWVVVKDGTLVPDVIKFYPDNDHGRSLGADDVRARRNRNEAVHLEHIDPPAIYAIGNERFAHGSYPNPNVPNIPPDHMH